MSTSPLKQAARESLKDALGAPQPPPLPTSIARPQEVQSAPVRAAFAFDPMEDALAAFGRGEFLVVSDDESRENEGDLIIAASEVSTEKMAWMIKHTRYVSPVTSGSTNVLLSLSGYICISLPSERLEELEIPMMVDQNEDPHRTAYTVTVDYKFGTVFEFMIS